jgi:hypothetical protein
MYEEATFSSIAKSEDLLINREMPNVSYVKREVKKVLKEIDLPIREELLKPGRRKGSKDKKPRQPRRESTQ